MKRLFEEARSILNIASVSHSGNEEVSNYLISLMQDRGLQVKSQQVMHSFEEVSKKQYNIIGILGDPLVDRKIRKGLLLLTHLDTADSGLPENWTQTEGKPFRSVQKGDRIYGLGAVDAKLDFLCKLHAVHRFRDKKLKAPVYLAGTCGGELGMFGCKYLIESLVVNPEYTLIGMPTGLNLVRSHKSSLVAKVTLAYHTREKDAGGFNRRVNLFSYGKSSHAAYPDSGSNAVVMLLEFLNRSIENGFEIRFTSLSGGGMVNAVPDFAKTEFYLTSHQFEDYKRFFNEVHRETSGNKDQKPPFRMEVGALGDIGISFHPDDLFPCISEIVAAFQQNIQSLSKKTDNEFDPPISTLNVGKIFQEFKKTTLEFDLRLLPSVNQTEFENQIKESMNRIAGKYPNLNIMVQIERKTPVYNISSDISFINHCMEIFRKTGVDAKVTKTSLATEAGYFHQQGYDALVFGPGSSKGSSHCPNESIELEQLEKAVSFYSTLIESVCL